VRAKPTALNIVTDTNGVLDFGRGSTLETTEDLSPSLADQSTGISSGAAFEPRSPANPLTTLRYYVLNVRFVAEAKRRSILESIVHATRTRPPTSAYWHGCG
jgi:hypothetical protein